MSAPKSAVSYHCDSGLGIIHIADGRGNRLNPAALAELSSALETGLEDENTKILMMRSGEDSFCLGMDLDNLEGSLAADSDGGTTSETEGGEQQGGESQHRSSGVDGYSRLLQRIASCSKPVIALVEGDVKAGGVGLASACDIVIASQNASYELSEVLFGLVPYNVLPYVFSLRMSPQRFRYLVLSAKRLDAETAANYGLIDELYPVETLEKKLKATIKTMMRAQGEALAASKSFFTDMIDSSFTGRRAAAQDALLEKMRDPAVLEGLQAFSNGDIPPWFLRFKPEGRLGGRGES